MSARVFLGMSGGAFRFAVLKPGKVLTSTNQVDYLIDTAITNMQPMLTGTVTVLPYSRVIAQTPAGTPGTDGYNVQETNLYISNIYHGLGYVPLVFLAPLQKGDSTISVDGQYLYIATLGFNTTQGVPSSINTPKPATMTILPVSYVIYSSKAA